MKFVLFLLFTLSISASVEIPKPDYGDLNNNIRCIQGDKSCACCEEFFSDCKKGSVEIFLGKCTEIDALIYEIRNSIYYDDET